MTLNFNNIKNCENWNFFPERKEIEKTLKPCPFCGGERIDFALMHPQFAGKPDMTYWSFWQVLCTDCGANIENGCDEPTEQEWEQAKDELIEAWNRRVS